VALIPGISKLPSVSLGYGGQFPLTPRFQSCEWLSESSGIISYYPVQHNRPRVHGYYSGDGNCFSSEVMNITNWSYTKIAQTFDTDMTYNYYESYKIPKGNSRSGEFKLTLVIYFDGNVSSSCFTTTNKPWLTCNIPDSFSFTLFQSLPKFVSQYNASVYTTNVFNLNFESAAASSEYGYQLKGKLKLTKVTLHSTELKCLCRGTVPHKYSLCYRLCVPVRTALLITSFCTSK
jgi:hypothetical protein